MATFKIIIILDDDSISFWSKQDPFNLQGLGDSVEDNEVIVEAKADFFFSCLRSLNFFGSWSSFSLLHFSLFSL